MSEPGGPVVESSATPVQLERPSKVAFAGWLVVAVFWFGGMILAVLAAGTVVAVALSHAPRPTARWLRDVLAPREWRWKGVRLAIVAGLCAFGFQVAGGVIHDVLASGAAPTDGLTEHRSQVIGGSQGLGAQVGMIALAVVVAPLLEELLMRGLLLLGGLDLLRRYGVSGRAVTAVVLVCVSVVFGLGHLQYDLFERWLVVGTGLIFGAVALRTRNVLMATLAHAILNGLWVVGALTSGQ